MVSKVEGEYACTPLYVSSIMEDPLAFIRRMKDVGGEFKKAEDAKRFGWYCDLALAWPANWRPLVQDSWPAPAALPCPAATPGSSLQELAAGSLVQCTQ